MVGRFVCCGSGVLFCSLGVVDVGHSYVRHDMSHGVNWFVLFLGVGTSHAYV